MHTLIERSFLAGVGLLSMTHDKAQKIVDELTQRGEVKKDDAKDWVEQLIHRGEEERQTVRKLIHDEVKNALDELGLATKEDIQELAAKGKARNKEGQA